MPVFSSDYPHFEGSCGPVEHYRSELGDLPAEAAASFLGASIAECYARMGDPVTV